MLVLYGDAWHAASPVIQALAVGAALSTFGVVPGRALVALGRTRDVCAIEWGSQAVRLGLTVMALPHGLPVVAWVQVAANSITTLAYVLVAVRALGISVGALFRMIAQAAVMGVAVAGPSYLILEAEAQLGRFGAIVLSSFASALCWYFAARLCRHSVVGEIQRLVGRRVSGRPAGSMRKDS